MKNHEEEGFVWEKNIEEGGSRLGYICGWVVCLNEKMNIYVNCFLRGNIGIKIPTVREEERTITGHRKWGGRPPISYRTREPDETGRRHHVNKRYSRNFVVDLLRKWMNKSEYVPLGGIAYYISAPSSSEDMAANPFHSLFFVVFMLSAYALSQSMWLHCLLQHLLWEKMLPSSQLKARMIHLMSHLQNTKKGSQYESVVVNLTSQDKLTLQEVQFMLQNHEMRLELTQSTALLDLNSPQANIAQAKKHPCSGCSQTGRPPTSNTSHNATRGRGRGNSSYRGRGSSSNSRVICQLCGRSGHTVQHCYKRFDVNFTGVEDAAPP
uniref:Uncharacterized protein n=1 Tax=Cannabis sativa TaxID=3483 RepID=A0A803NK75_CANSA